MREKLNSQVERKPRKRDGKKVQKIISTQQRSLKWFLHHGMVDVWGQMTFIMGVAFCTVGC